MLAQQCSVQVARASIVFHQSQKAVEAMNYSTILHVLGQELDSLKPVAYEVVCYGNSYLVRCRVKEDPPNTKADEKKVRKLPAFLRLWREEEKPPSQEVDEGAFM